MMILKRIFSKENLFNEVIFNSGINIILGKYNVEGMNKREINGIGKSSLIRLIDFSLLSDDKKTKYFNSNKYSLFRGYSVTLEFKIGNEEYLIERNFNEPDSPKFGKKFESLVQYDISELRLILGGLIFGQYNYEGNFDNVWFRRLIKFYIKDDLEQFTRLEPYNFLIGTSKFEIFQYNLFLMNLPNSEMALFSVNKKEKKELNERQKSVIESLKKREDINYEQIGSEINLLDNKIRLLEDQMGNYSFLNSYENLEENLIKLSSEISSLLREINILERRLHIFEKDYSKAHEFDTNKVAEFYNEINNSFGEFVKKNLDEVVNFRKNIDISRKRFVEKRKNEIEDQLKLLKKQLNEKENLRSKDFNYLNEQKAFDSIKNIYAQLVEEKSKKERYSAITKEVNSLDSSIVQKQEEIANNVKNLKNMYDEEKNQIKIKEITSLFFEIVQKIIFVSSSNEAFLDIRAISDMKSPFTINCKIPKTFSLGKSRLLILIYDLTLFFNTINKKYDLPHFIIHDGVFHTIESDIKVKALNLIYSQYLENLNFQYIFTINEDELKSLLESKETLNFDVQKNIVAIYENIPDKMIFKKEF